MYRIGHKSGLLDWFDHKIWIRQAIRWGLWAYLSGGLLLAQKPDQDDPEHKKFSFRITFGDKTLFEIGNSEMDSESRKQAWEERNRRRIERQKARHAKRSAKKVADKKGSISFFNMTYDGKSLSLREFIHLVHSDEVLGKIAEGEINEADRAAIRKELKIAKEQLDDVKKEVADLEKWLDELEKELAKRGKK